MYMHAQTFTNAQPNDLYASSRTQPEINMSELPENDSTIAVFQAVMSFILLSDSNRYQQGVLDAQRLYPKKNTGAGGTFFTCFLLDPILGLIPAIICSSTPPKTNNLGVADADLLNDTEYMRGYTEEAHKMKKKKVWTGFGAGTGAYLVVLAIYFGGQ